MVSEKKVSTSHWGPDPMYIIPYLFFKLDFLQQSSIKDDLFLNARAKDVKILPYFFLVLKKMTCHYMQKCPLSGALNVLSAFDLKWNIEL